MDKTAVALIESPFQLLCAIEACAEFEIRSAKFYIRLVGQATADRLLLNLVALLDIDEYKTFILPVSAPAARKIWVWLRALHPIRCSDYLILGSARSPALRVMGRFGKEVIVVDDGLETVEHYLNSRPLEIADHVFTCFIPPARFPKYIANELKTTRALRGAGERKCTVFVGSVLVETGKIEEARYCQSISAIVERERSGNLIYFPHRHECKEKLARLEKIDGLEIRHQNHILEIELLAQGLRPKRVYSYYSTCVTTLPLIFEDVKIHLLTIDKIDGIIQGDRRTREDALDIRRIAALQDYLLQQEQVNHFRI
jgi:hypothetical protein